MVEEINELMATVESCNEDLEEAASKLGEYYLTQPTSPWDEKTTIKNLRPVDALVIGAHKIAWDLKNIEVLVSVDPDNFEDVNRLHGLVLSCRGKVSWFEEFFRQYVEYGSKKDSVLQVYTSMQSMYQSAKVMLEKSSQWIYELCLEREKLVKLRKARYIVQPRKKGLVSQASSLSLISEENSEDDYSTPMEGEPSFSGAEKGTGQIEGVSTQLNVQDDLISRDQFCEECNCLRGQLSELQLVVNAIGAYPSFYIATATYYTELLNEILDRKRKLILLSKGNFEQFKNFKEWEDFEVKLNEVWKAFAEKTRQYAG